MLFAQFARFMAREGDLMPSVFSKIKGRLRPLYHRVVKGVSVEPEARIVIEQYGPYEIAHRPGTDAIIAGNYAGYEAQRLLPGYSPGPADTVIHIGAHIGVSVLVASTESPKGIIHAIEAARDTYNLLRINIALNCAQNVRPHYLAISDAGGEVRLYHDIGHWGHSITRPMSGHYETVPAVSLEQFLNSNGVDRCQFLYLNCEGAEFPILMGAPAATLQRFDRILADCHPHLANGKTAHELASYLAAAGLRTEILVHEGSYNRVAAFSQA
jgi:FkbM family methyltransferase